MYVAVGHEDRLAIPMAENFIIFLDENDRNLLFLDLMHASFEPTMIVETAR